MIKISTIKQIMENEELKTRLEKIQTREEFEQLCKEYDFSALQEEELNEESLEHISGGWYKPISRYLIEQLKKITKKKPQGGGGGGGGRF